MPEHRMRKGDKVWDKDKKNGVIHRIIYEEDSGLHEVMVIWQDGSWTIRDKDDFDGRYTNETFGYMFND